MKDSMKKSFGPKYAVVWCMLVLAFMFSCTPLEHKSIVILYENDVHCNLNNYARMKALANAIGDTAWVGMTSSGDYLHGGTAGAISEGHYILDVMREMNYDAIGLGNHEFDFGLAHLLNIMDEKQMPVVSLNLRQMHTDSLLFAPYIIRQYGKRRVAFLGVVTPESLVSEAYSFYDKKGTQLYNLCENNMVEVVQSTIDKVRGQGVDYVVLLSHLGEASAKKFITSTQLISQTHGIDVVLDGHTHSRLVCDTVMNSRGEAVLVSQTGSRFKNVGKLLITPNGHISTELIPVDSLTDEDAGVRAVLDSIDARMSEVISEKVCHSLYPMDILDANGRQLVRYRETCIGNLVTDAFRAMTGAQLAVNNGGGIRAPLVAGDWTYGNIVDALPYNNYLTLVKIKGNKLVELLLATTSNTPMEDGQFPQISGFRFILNEKAEGEARISSLEILDDRSGRYKPVNPDAEYTLCTTDYCVTGGGMYGVLRDAEILQENIMLYNQAFIKYVTEYLDGEIPERYAKIQGRIQTK